MDTKTICGNSTDCQGVKKQKQQKTEKKRKKAENILK